MTSTGIGRAAALDLAAAVAARAAGYPYRIWGFGEGMALRGLLRAGLALDRPEWIDRVADVVAPSLSGPAAPTDHLIPVDVLVELHLLRPTLDVRPAVHRFRRAVLGAPRPVPGRPAVHRPDLTDLATTVWVDCLHTDGPGLVLAGVPGAAVRAVETAAAALQDASGLFSHGYDVATGRANAVHWARGQGWALHGLIAVAGQLAGDPAATRCAALLAALARTELDGRWRTIVDDPGAPVEASLSALVASGVREGVRRGRVGTEWLPLARRALVAAVAATDGDGGLPVSTATPVGRPDTYLDRDDGVFPWGQGPLLLALLDEVPS